MRDAADNPRSRRKNQPAPHAEETPFGTSLVLSRAGAPAEDIIAGTRPNSATVEVDSPNVVPTAFNVALTRKGNLPVTLEKRAKGKWVTVVRNVTGDAAGLLQFLKKKCGAGGVVKEDTIELQGDHRAKVQAYLKPE